MLSWFYPSAPLVPAVPEDIRIKRAWESLTRERFMVYLNVFLKIFASLLYVAEHIAYVDSSLLLPMMMFAIAFLLLCVYSRKIWPVVTVILVIQWSKYATDFAYIVSTRTGNFWILEGLLQLIKPKYHEAAEILQVVVHCMNKPEESLLELFHHPKDCFIVLKAIACFLSHESYAKIKSEIGMFSYSITLFTHVTYFIIVDLAKLFGAVILSVILLVVYGFVTCDLNWAIFGLILIGMGVTSVYYAYIVAKQANFTVTHVVTNIHSIWTQILDSASFPDELVRLVPGLHKVSIYYVGFHFLENKVILNILNVAVTVIHGIENIREGFRKVCEGLAYARDVVVEHSYISVATLSAVFGIGFLRNQR